MAEGSSSVAVMADAQFGNVRVLLPFEGFEDVYQGQAGSVPIAFPGGRDPNAEAQAEGFDPDLCFGHPVPRGSRISIGIPVCEDAQSQRVDYRYFFVFRDRNLRDYRGGGVRGNRVPFHYAKQGLGALDTLLAVPQRRYPVDARFHTLAYEQAEPAAGDPAILHLYPEGVIPRVPLDWRPLLPDGAVGALEQGIYDPAFFNVPGRKIARRAEFQIDCLGDDLIILAQKIPDDQGEFEDWAFLQGEEDDAFANIYGELVGGGNVLHEQYVDAGIRVTTGSNP
jgi:hypothetical protein